LWPSSALCRIYLFGSRARGESGPETDYDLLVLVEDPGEPTCRLSQRTYRALRGIAAAAVRERSLLDAA